MVDIPESLPGVPDVSCVRRRDMPLPSPSVSGLDAPPSRSDTPTYASSSGGPSAALCTPSSSVALGAPSSSAALGVPPSGGTSTSATFGSPPSSPSILTRCFVSLCASPPADSCRPVLSPGHLPHTDGSLRSPPPTAPASRSSTPPPQVVSPLQRELGARSRRFPHLLGELSPISDMPVVPSIIELQGRFPGLGAIRWDFHQCYIWFPSLITFYFDTLFCFIVCFSTC